MTSPELTFHSVLAGAFGRNPTAAQLARSVVHASRDGGETALCKRVKPGHLCDLLEDGPPTCPTCLKRLEASREP